MPDPNGTAVVMKFNDVLGLEHLFLGLHRNSVPAG